MLRGLHANTFKNFLHNHNSKICIHASSFKERALPKNGFRKAERIETKGIHLRVLQYGGINVSKTTFGTKDGQKLILPTRLALKHFMWLFNN
jgi:hypothetical protein